MYIYLVTSILVLFICKCNGHRYPSEFDMQTKLAENKPSDHLSDAKMKLLDSLLNAKATKASGIKTGDPAKEMKTNELEETRYYCISVHVACNFLWHYSVATDETAIFETCTSATEFKLEISYPTSVLMHAQVGGTKLIPLPHLAPRG